MAPSFNKLASAAVAAVALLSNSALAEESCKCVDSQFNQTVTEYPITVKNTTVFDVAKATNRGVCDIGRLNLMADVTIWPDVGQTLLIPPQVCEPDNETCLIPDTNRTRTCINGGARLYWTVNGDTYDKIARRLNVSTESVSGGADAHEVLEKGQFVKIDQCYPSQCITQPYTMAPDGKRQVYLDLAREYDTTVGQIMMLSPNYNYSIGLAMDDPGPTIVLPINCTLLSSNFTVLH